jgi:hypothetical protein
MIDSQFASSLLLIFSLPLPSLSFTPYNLQTDELRAPHGHHERIAKSHVGKGLYFYQLALWFHTLPRRLFLVVQMERYYRDPSEGLSEVLRFVGVNSLGPGGFATPEA